MLKDELPRVKTTLPGPKAKAVIEQRAAVMPSAIRCAYPVVISRGEGAMVEDVDGNLFLDWVGGVGVLNIGYSHPDVVKAVREQADRYFHAMVNIITHEGAVALAGKLNAIVPVKEQERRTMFTNSGAETLENAVKIARSSSGRPNIIVFSGAFHGRTLLTATMTSKKAYYHGMGPLPDGIYRAEFPYLYRAPKGLTEDEAVEYYLGRFNAVFEEASPPEDVAAIVIEPVQGEGGFIPVPEAWIKAVRAICDKHGILIIADEVQTGFGRSGRLFVSNYWEEWGCPPDIIAMAKSIAGGLPLGAITAGASIYAKVAPGTIGGTFGGNALSCASALKVIEIMERDKLPERARAIAGKARAAFTAWQKDITAIGDVRGIGAMLGIEFVKDERKTPWPELVTETVAEAARNGLIIESAGTYGNVIRFLCPLVVTDAQLERGLEILKTSIQYAVKKTG
ncbi:MAG: aspartate aminotransferase family protein [Spirochaetaceae bacterium]|jgi:4-aminobutyrate aminotransferase/(S)-3-amino-2-methylpropionate transaminase|nr:aspartate aminotransferase family protein [Spirochaetaceae bacterium]